MFHYRILAVSRGFDLSELPQHVVIRRRLPENQETVAIGRKVP
jgi:hypothetical protein